MKKEIAMKWVAALRSGDYKQAHRQLRSRSTNGFCCLGVLCNLHAQAHPTIAASQTDAGSYLGHSHVLPEEVIRWANLYSDVGGNRHSKMIEIGGGEYSHLALANDHGMPFSKIADWIEENYKEL